MTTLIADVTEVKPMNDDSINDERIDAHLADIDRETAGSELSLDDPRIQRLIAAAAPHSIEITVDEVPTIYNPAVRRRLGYVYHGHCYMQFGYYLGPFTDEAINDLTAYFQNLTPHEENYVNIYSTDLFKYLSGDMIGQNTITLTITKFTEEKMSAGGRGEQIKQCLHFKERDKTMVLNKTNANAIAKELGPETDQWAGGRITLAAPVIDAFGQQRRAIRVIKVEPPDVPAKSRSGNGNPADGGNGNS